MKKTFIIFVSMVIVAAFVSSASAVDRAPKKSGSEGKKETTEIKEMTKEKAKQKSRKSTFSEKIAPAARGQKKTEASKAEKTKDRPGARKSKEKYDYFIDGNNNGIDDRLEKEAKAEKTEKQEPARKPDSVTKHTPTPSDKTPAKVNPAPKPAEKAKEKKVSPKKTPGVQDGEKKEERRRR